MTSSSSPSDALLELMAPDGYYRYLKIPKKVVPKDAASGTTDSGSVVDEDLIKKSYRKLSLKHHPDKQGGDVDTFRVLNRAQKVLTNPKLRQQYDILGIDLDDDEDQDVSQQEDESKDPPTTAQGIVQEIASMVIAGIIQLLIRTVMMAAVAVLLVRFRWTLYPALAFLAYIAFRIDQQAREAGGSPTDVWSPLAIATGLMLMHNSTSSSWIFFWGESLVIFMFTYNSASSAIPLGSEALAYGGMAILSMVAALWLRGMVWNYLTIIIFEGILALLAALAFPVMELVLETILNEKLRKVGDKVRQHHQILEKHYQSRMGDDR